MRFYLHHSSIFDNPDNIYDINLFKKVIKNNGGKNIRTSNNYGWSNQPKIISFNANIGTLKDIENGLNKLPVFDTWGCIIFHKD